MASPATAQVVDGDVKQGQGLGVSGTPSMFINGPQGGGRTSAGRPQAHRGRRAGQAGQAPLKQRTWADHPGWAQVRAVRLRRSDGFPALQREQRARGYQPDVREQVPDAGIGDQVLAALEAGEVALGQAGATCGRAPVARRRKTDAREQRIGEGVGIDQNARRAGGEAAHAHQRADHHLAPAGLQLGALEGVGVALELLDADVLGDAGVLDVTGRARRPPRRAGPGTGWRRRPAPVAAAAVPRTARSAPGPARRAVCRCTVTESSSTASRNGAVRNRPDMKSPPSPADVQHVRGQTPGEAQGRASSGAGPRTAPTMASAITGSTSRSVRTLSDQVGGAPGPATCHGRSTRSAWRRRCWGRRSRSRPREDQPGHQRGEGQRHRPPGHRRRRHTLSTRVGSTSRRGPCG
jgi:hypothetical protein